MPKRLPEITIIRDTREQKGWIFDEEEKQAGKIRILGTVTEMLDAGDYSIKGYEDIIRIERKNGFCELFGNMTPVANKERFERELEKLKVIPHKYIVVESNISNDVMGLSVPQFYKSPPASSVLKWMLNLQMEYNIIPIFAGDAGKRVAKYIFDSVVRKYL